MIDILLVNPEEKEGFLINKEKITIYGGVHATFTAIETLRNIPEIEILQHYLKFPWECEVRVGTVDMPLFEKMQKAGCYYVDIKAESASQKGIC